MLYKDIKRRIEKGSDALQRYKRKDVEGLGCSTKI